MIGQQAASWLTTLTAKIQSERRPLSHQETVNLLLALGEFIREVQALEDFIMHYLAGKCGEYGIRMKFHTGLQEGNGNDIENSNPALLTNLFMEYPNVRFDLFHIGYPFQHVLSALAKNFRNVFIDFCWAHMISPSAAVEALLDYLDAVPANKISGFGGDYIFIDGVYGHQVLARQNIARALSIKVDQDVFDMDRARQLARMILHDNPAALFGLGQ